MVKKEFLSHKRFLKKVDAKSFYKKPKKYQKSNYRTKDFKTISEQIFLLKRRGLSIDNDFQAGRLLKHYGYYELINGYKYDFMVDKTDDDKGFKVGASLEHIYGIYDFDKNLRQATKDSLEIFEQSFKQAISYVISNKISDNQLKYADLNNYLFQTSKGSTRDYLINKVFKDVFNSDHDPYKHYRKKYGNIPPWILVKGLTFGKAVNWFFLCKSEIKKAIVRLMMPEAFSLVKKETDVLRLFGDMLSLLLDYRNRASHGGRIYNYRPNKSIVRNYIEPFHREKFNISKRQFKKSKKYRKSLGAILMFFSLLDNYSIYLSLYYGIKLSFELHLKNYPEDMNTLIREIEIEKTDLLNEVTKVRKQL